MNNAKLIWTLIAPVSVEVGEDHMTLKMDSPTTRNAYVVKGLLQEDGSYQGGCPDANGERIVVTWHKIGNRCYGSWLECGVDWQFSFSLENE
jgi:hypothetical protein